MVNNGDLVSYDSSGRIYTHKGISNILTGSFDISNDTSSISISPYGDLVTTNQTTAHIYIYNGISSTITGSFASPNTWPVGITFDLSGNMITSDNQVDYIYVHSGISTVLTGSFSLSYPSNALTHISIDNSGNLIAIDTPNNTIYFYNGISSTSTDDFVTTYVSTKGIDVDPLTNNLLNISSSTDHIYIYSGIGSTLIGSFTSPNTNPSSLRVYNVENVVYSGTYDDNITLNETFLLKSFTASKITEDITTTETFELNKAISDFKFIININGVNTLVDTCSVKKTIGETNNSNTFTATINNYKGTKSEDFTIGDEVVIYYDKFIYPKYKIFTGILENIDLKGKELKETLTLSGRDYSARLMDRTVEPESYKNELAGDIIKDIISKYCDDITTDNVDDGKVIPRIIFKQISLFDAINQLAEQCDYMFFVDENKDLHFKEEEMVSSGYTFNSTNILSTTFKEERNSIYNDIWVYGDRYLDAYSQTIKAGSPVGGSIFTLLYKPHNTSVSVSGAIIQPGGIYQMTYNPGSEVKYLVNYDEKQIIFTSGTTAGNNIPSSGNSVVISYMRDLPIIKVGENNASINKYGRRTKIIQDTNIKDPLIAESVLLSELDLYSDPIKEGRLALKDVNILTPGETCIVDIPIYGINNTEYKILDVNYTFNKNTELKGNVLDVVVNKKIPDVTDTLKDILLQLKNLQSVSVSDTDLLTRYKFTTGSFSIRQSGIEVWTRTIGSSFILGHPTLGLLGSYTTHCLGGYKSDFILQYSGGYF
jgi:hypothetical protein